ncbi:carbohydrate ABC transporter permease [Consotaella aegiceratis]|uniref:carbohydrate ABC transporter permease n=1 Tax=Consotaella aegiceratis TaxID=3097961 RepID=UPI002F417E89
MTPRQRRSAIGLHLILLPLALIWLAPLWLMLTYATIPESEFFQPGIPLLFGHSFVENWRTLLKVTPFGQAMFNSVVTSTLFTVASVFLTSLAGYSFARYRFFGRNAIFSIVIATMTVPYFVLVIPQFVLVAREFGLTNTWAAVIIPPLFNSVGVFFMRQNFLSLPQDMLDAARMDGVGEVKIFLFVALPLVLPATAALAIILFLQSWNNYLWPLLVLSQPAAQTAPVALGALVGLDRVYWGAVMVAAVVMTVPVLIVFLFLQRYFIAGITAGAVK